MNERKWRNALWREGGTSGKPSSLSGDGVCTCVQVSVCVSEWQKDPLRVQERNLCAAILHLHSWRFSPQGELIRFLLTGGCWGWQISSAYTHAHTTHLHTLLFCPSFPSLCPPSPLLFFFNILCSSFSPYLPLSIPRFPHLLICPSHLFCKCFCPCSPRGLPTRSYTVKGIVAQRCKGISEPGPNPRERAETENLHHVKKSLLGAAVCRDPGTCEEANLCVLCILLRKAFQRHFIQSCKG